MRESNAVTSMIARRMFNHYQSQKDLKKEISLSTIPSASGVFQQVLGSYLRAYLQGLNPSFTVQLDKGYGNLHPDSAVEKDGQPWSAIEVKTDLGWNRNYISSGDWTKRSESIRQLGFRDAYLVLLANANWSGWDASMETFGIKVILWHSPNDRRFKWYKDNLLGLDVGSDPSADILHPVEPLFERIAGVEETP